MFSLLFVQLILKTTTLKSFYDCITNHMTKSHTDTVNPNQALFHWITLPSFFSNVLSKVVAWPQGRKYHISALNALIMKPKWLSSLLTRAFDCRRHTENRSSGLGHLLSVSTETLYKKRYFFCGVAPRPAGGSGDHFTPAWGQGTLPRTRVSWPEYSCSESYFILGVWSSIFAADTSNLSYSSLPNFNPLWLHLRRLVV